MNFTTFAVVLLPCVPQIRDQQPLLVAGSEAQPAPTSPRAPRIPTSAAAGKETKKGSERTPAHKRVSEDSCDNVPLMPLFVESAPPWQPAHRIVGGDLPQECCPKFTWRRAGLRLLFSFSLWGVSVDASIVQG